MNLEKWHSPDQEILSAYKALAELSHFEIGGFSELLVEIYYSLILSNPLLTGDAIDAGANVGRHASRLTLLTSLNEKRTLIIEPNVDLHPIIRANCEAEQCHNFVLLPNAVARVGGQILEFSVFDDIQISALKENMNTVHAQKTPEKMLLVETITLAQAISNHQLAPAFIKLDIEGRDFETLADMVQMLDTYRPFIVAELVPTDAPSEPELIDLLKLYSEKNYVCVDGFGMVYNRYSWVYRDSFIYWNRFFIPGEYAALVLPSFRKMVRELWFTLPVMQNALPVFA